MKLIKIVGIMSMIGVIAIGLMGCSSEGNQFLPEQVLKNALESASELGDYYAEAEMKIYEKDTILEHMLVKEWVSEDGKRRTEIESQDGSETSIAVNDGERLISYQPEKKQAFVIEDPELLSFNQVSPKQQAEQLLKMIQDTHDVALGGEEEIAGRSTYHVSARAQETTSLFGDQELWIDKENWLVLKMISISGDMKTELVYTKVEFNPEIPAETFTLELPDDVHILNLDEMNKTREVTLAEAAENIGHPFLHFPETDGLTIARVELLELKGELDRTEVNVDYHQDGLPYLTLTVFQSPQDEGEPEMFPGEEAVTIRGQEGTYMEMNDFRSLYWQENGLNYSIILVDPHLTVKDLKVLADKMTPVK
ncbi:LolA family protein [Caldalkalibacillus uzonensis]|uniref:LolA family protein n=1 Tax=Caldalkalibacillus uzonensis TaxID=353224 RepID=UPI0027D8077F|nr:sigma-E factor regulatory protein RseB domain-containing protein [Caldalkalibacillus uzonensis]